MTDYNAPRWIGKTIGHRYEITELLGQGGMSAVFKAHDPNLKRTVAVKIIHPHLTEKPEFVQRFEQEAAVVAQLRHNNIVQVYDFNHQGSVYFMVMEYLVGETLDKKIKTLNEAGMRMPLADAVRIVATLCEAVDFAHQRRMIHRDLKPANIMINLVGEPILMDFGIAKIIGGQIHTQTGAAIGTAAYMSPEQVRGQDVDHRSDIYALGIILYEILGGSPPFQSDSSFEVMRQHMESPIPDIQEVNANTPNSLVAIIEKALAKDPEHRYQTAAEMGNALRTAAIHFQSPMDTLAARHLGLLSQLWQEAQDLLDDRAYGKCLDKLDELKRADADYKQEQVADMRQEAINRMYGRAVKLYNAGKLAPSHTAVQDLRQRMPQYPGLDQLESQILEGMAQQEAQTRLQKLYGEAVNHLDNRQYEQALERWQAIQQAPGSFNFPDNLQVEKRARQGIAGNLYTKALAVLGQGDLNQALALWQSVRQYDSDFPDKQNLVAEIEAQRLNQQRKRRFYLRIGGGVAVVMILVAIGFFVFRGGGHDGVETEKANLAMTETAVALAILPPATETATNTPAPTDTAVPPTATVTQPPTNTPTQELEPTASPTARPSDTPPAAPTGEPTPENQAVVLENSSLFSTPDTNADEITLLHAEDTVLVYGRSPTSNWLYVIDQDGNRGFVALDRLDWNGDVTKLPVFTGSTTPTEATPVVSQGDLDLNIWGLPDTVRCEASGSAGWYQTIFMEGTGGSGPYTYFWEGRQVGGPVNNSITTELHSNGGAIVGTGTVTSSDGQTVSKELFLGNPGCN
ncbi:MAG: protein kinase [Anaerolineae bacterium]